ncbi:MAG: prepilin-type N-terminal cleavage/methylation domain-containing protein [Acidobacteriota bacterium]|nr:prepilin-type N-terminal cleavage/methylation domain-containing protein [Acidobacteriota bacterium]
MLRLLRHRRLVPDRTPSEHEGGFTLVELMVAMTVSIIVLSMMATMVAVYAKADTSIVNNADAASQVRLVLLQLQSDIQAANPLSTLSSVTAYDDELQMTVQPSGKLITWQYSYNTGNLTRQIGTSTAAVELTHVTNGNPSSGGEAVFGYYDHCSTNLVTQAQATPSNISGSATDVQVSLAVDGLDTAPYGSTTTTHIMAQAPGTNLCG